MTVTTTTATPTKLGTATIDTARLRKALDRIAKVKAHRHAPPVLHGVLLAGDDDGLTLTAFDLETSLTIRVSDEPSTLRALVDLGTLRDVAKRLAQRKLPTVDLALDGSKLRVSHAKGEVDMLTLPIEDYPQLPVVRADDRLTVGDRFIEDVTRVAVAAGRDDTLPALTGILVECDRGNVTLAATDRYRLAVAELGGVADGTWKALLDVLATVDDDAFTINVQYDDRDKTGGTVSWVALNAGDVFATFRLIDGEFPRFRALIPSDFTAEVRAINKDMREAVASVAAVAERNTPIRLSFDKADGAELTFEAGTGDEVQAVERVATGFIDSDSTIAFNPSYFDDGLSVLGDRVRLSIVASNKPALLRTVADDSFTYLIMPVRIGA